MSMRYKTLPHKNCIDTNSVPSVSRLPAKGEPWIMDVVEASMRAFENGGMIKGIVRRRVDIWWQARLGEVGRARLGEVVQIQLHVGF